MTMRAQPTRHSNHDKQSTPHPDLPQVPDELKREIREDARQSPAEYARDSAVPGGGE